MVTRNRIYAAIAAAVLLGGTATVIGISQQASAGGSGCNLDDGKELLPQAKISLADAIAAAQSAESGDIGEVDLEYFQNTLVFNVDVGSHDVKVDAATGQVVGSTTDD
jgi:uncharacterized membrane protein YkoI